MFYRHQDLQEGFVHQCADSHKYNMQHRQEIARVQKHDTKHFLRLDNQIIDIAFCPYCGAKLSDEETTNEFLKLKLL